MMVKLVGAIASSARVVTVKSALHASSLVSDCNEEHMRNMAGPSLGFTQSMLGTPPVIGWSMQLHSASARPAEI